MSLVGSQVTKKKKINFVHGYITVFHTWIHEHIDVQHRLVYIYDI